MNKSIETLNKELNIVLSKNQRSIDLIRGKLSKAYAKVFEKDKALAKALTNLESSNKYGSDDNGIYCWYRHSRLENIEEDARKYFEEYVSGYNVNVDWDNSCLTAYDGGSFIINDDGDVYDTDSGKYFIDHRNYKSVEERNKMIEKHMERNDYYPGVYSVDRHGNVLSVNTSQK